MNDSSHLRRLQDQATQGDAAALESLFSVFRDRLRQMLQFRMDPRLQSRIDASDVLQDAFLEASERLTEFSQNPPMSVFLWLRFLVTQRLVQLHRHHLGIKARDANREVSLYGGPYPAASSAALAAQLIGGRTSPSVAAIRAERMLRLQEALNGMDPIDREVLTLRHFESLSRAETALVLGIEESAAGKRYLRALKRLKKILIDLDSDVGN